MLGRQRRFKKLMFAGLGSRQEHQPRRARWFACALLILVPASAIADLF